MPLFMPFPIYHVTGKGKKNGDLNTTFVRSTFQVCVPLKMTVTSVFFFFPRLWCGSTYASNPEIGVPVPPYKSYTREQIASST